MYLSLKITLTSSIDKFIFSRVSKNSLNFVYVQSKYLLVYNNSISVLNSSVRAFLGFLPRFPCTKNSFQNSL